MLRYAIIDGRKSEPFAGGRALCPTCGGGVIAKYGSIVVHHWAHRTAEDCDLWSEGIGPWHLSWQDVVRSQFAEVPFGPHRADILGNGDVVVELQHSPISPADIAQREQFYGNMVWLFDATHRFAGTRSGARFFFAFGRTKHMIACKKPVVLDFGEFLVQVEMLTSVLDKYSGFGLIRDRAWFVSQYRSERRAPGPIPPARWSDERSSTPWPGQQPWRLTAHASHWREPGSGQETVYREKTEYIPLDYDWRSLTNGRRPVWSDIITRHPELANGWTEAEIREMKAFFGGLPMILGGVLRLMPLPAEHLAVAQTAVAVRQLLERADGHIRAGRLPILKEATRQLLLQKAEQYETATYGKPLRSLTSRGGTVTGQRGLFD